MIHLLWLIFSAIVDIIMMIVCLAVGSIAVTALVLSFTSDL